MVQEKNRHLNKVVFNYAKVILEEMPGGTILITMENPRVKLMYEVSATIEVDASHGSAHPVIHFRNTTPKDDDVPL